MKIVIQMESVGIVQKLWPYISDTRREGTGGLNFKVVHPKLLTLKPGWKGDDNALSRPTP
jgi:hypothetical protein